MGFVANLPPYVPPPPTYGNWSQPQVPRYVIDNSNHNEIWDIFSLVYRAADDLVKLDDKEYSTREQAESADAPDSARGQSRTYQQRRPNQESSAPVTLNFSNIGNTTSLFSSFTSNNSRESPPVKVDERKQKKDQHAI